MSELGQFKSNSATLSTSPHRGLDRKPEWIHRDREAARLEQHVHLIADVSFNGTILPGHSCIFF